MIANAADNTCRPSRVQALAGKAVVQLAAGLSHSVALTADGEVWTFGSGQEGQLGLGHTHSEPSPRKVRGRRLLTVEKVTSVEVSWLFTCNGHTHSEPWSQKVRL